MVPEIFRCLRAHRCGRVIAMRQRAHCCTTAKQQNRHKRRGPLIALHIFPCCPLPFLMKRHGSLITVRCASDRLSVISLFSCVICRKCVSICQKMTLPCCHEVQDEKKKAQSG